MANTKNLNKKEKLTSESDPNAVVSLVEEGKYVYTALEMKEYMDLCDKEIQKNFERSKSYEEKAVKLMNDMRIVEAVYNTRTVESAEEAVRREAEETNRMKKEFKKVAQEKAEKVEAVKNLLKDFK